MISAAQALVQRAQAAEADTPVPSPCISICRIDPAAAMCEGCFRTLDEIAAWSRMDDAGKRIVWRSLVQRAQAQP